MEFHFSFRLKVFTKRTVARKVRREKITFSPRPFHEHVIFVLTARILEIFRLKYTLLSICGYTPYLTKLSMFYYKDSTEVI